MVVRVQAVIIQAVELQREVRVQAEAVPRMAVDKVLIAAAPATVP